MVVTSIIAAGRSINQRMPLGRVHRPNPKLAAVCCTEVFPMEKRPGQLSADLIVSVQSLPHRSSKRLKSSGNWRHRGVKQWKSSNQQHKIGYLTLGLAIIRCLGYPVLPYSSFDIPFFGCCRLSHHLYNDSGFVDKVSTGLLSRAVL